MMPSDDDWEETGAPGPRVIPVFPLAGAILLPRGNLPLNIFEPRYLAMVRDALASDRVIGMIQPRDPASSAFEPPLYEIGCLGRITEHRNLPDGRMLITLHGVCRFEILSEEARHTPYRKVQASYARFARDRSGGESLPVERRERLIANLQRFLEDRQLTADWSVIGEAPDETLVNALAMICPFEPSEKQALLEADSLDARASTLIMLMEFALAEGNDTGGGLH
ncbi:MAG TPA: LON peptidase substrate-binding domain-containing protein [Sphingomonadales bacterium]